MGEFSNREKDPKILGILFPYREDPLCGRIFGRGVQVISMQGHMSGSHVNPMWNTRALDRREQGWIGILPNPSILGIGDSLGFGYRHKADDQAKIVWHPMSIDQKLSSPFHFPILLLFPLEIDTLRYEMKQIGGSVHSIPCSPNVKY